VKYGIEGCGLRRRQAVAWARDFRQAPTRAEAAVWEALRSRRLSGLKFRRQHPVGSFILDFYCPAHRLAIEIDGPIHANQSQRDAERQSLIEKHGIRFLRLTNAEVETNLETALRRILVAVSERSAPSHPFPASGEGAGG
jgi:very-short-patch-repair endonuclease